MIIEEIIDERLVKHYSDSNFKIRQVETGTVYDDAVDVRPCRFTYEETDEKIEEDESDLADKAEAYDILIGGAT